MELQLYFYKPMMMSYMMELDSVALYYRKSKPAFEFTEDDIRREVEEMFAQGKFPAYSEPAAIADYMEEMEGELYERYGMLKSNHLFITISMLAHMWEQQLVKFVRQELFDAIPAMDYASAKKIIESFGVKVSEKPYWGKIQELRALVNTIKHAEGKSASKLRGMRPDFFQVEGFSAGDFYDVLEVNGSVLLDPYSLNVKESDLLEYIEATKAFWAEMPDRAFYNPTTKEGRIEND